MLNNAQKTAKKHFLVKLILVAMLSIMMLGAMLGVNQPKKAEAAPNDYASVIRQVFGPYSDQAIRIAMCESTMNPDATNGYAIAGSHAAGLFQILYPSTWYTTSEGRSGHSPYDAAANIRAAYEIFSRDGYSWREWECHA